MDPSFWKGKKVLVTGHTGFQGSWLCLWLQRLGANVMGFALPPSTRPNLFDLAEIGEGIDSVFGDIREFDHFFSAFQKFSPEIVIHLAAQSLVRASFERPLETFSTNILGTVHVLEAARCHPVARAVLCITSDKCYENREWLWGYRENDSLGGKDPYSGSKSAAELVIASYRHAFFQKDPTLKAQIASARSGNIIGGGDWAQDRLVPDIMRSLLAGQPVTLRNPAAVRPWQHMLEPLNGYLTLIEKLWGEGEAYTGSWNFGPSEVESRPVSWIAESLMRLWGRKDAWFLNENDAVQEEVMLRLDSTKAKTLLGWSSRLELIEYLQWTVEWYRDFLSGKAMGECTWRQILRFCEKEVK